MLVTSITDMDFASVGLHLAAMHEISCACRFGSTLALQLVEYWTPIILEPALQQERGEITNSGDGAFREWRAEEEKC